MWSYWRDDFAEYGSWSGDDTPVSAVHFHNEPQLTFVISGCRYFRIGSEQVTVSAGSCLYIPTGCPHGSLPVSHPGTRCLNLYGDVLEFGPRPQIIQFLKHEGPYATPIGVAFAATGTALLSSEKPIGQLAAEAGMSREAFTRKFTRQTGIPPHAHNIVARLNEARRQLRSGAPLADVAAASGFFDQTHLTRHFYRVFGTTPGHYRKSVG
jgi:AraC-like DNA-binding protein